MKKEELLLLLGEMPKKSDLSVAILEEQDKETYIQRKIEYSSEEGERIPAYVLIPKLQGKLPAVFAHHQHGGNFEIGKSEVVGLVGDPQQAYAKELAERGYVVIAPDAIAFEERNDTANTGDSQYKEFTSRIIQGKSLNAKNIHDISVAVDYLCTLEEVDTNRIGFIGHSYGGQMALWYPAFDDRIKATVSNCRCISYRDSLINRVGIQMEFVIPGIVKWGDLGDVIGLYDSCALFVSATNKDKYSIGAYDLYEYVKSTYPNQNIFLKIYEGDHVFTKEMRENAYTWLDSRLK